MEYNDCIGILSEDFSNSYEQMRYYDSQINDLMKFSIGLYSTLLAAFVALIGIATIEKEVLTKILICSSIVVFIFGIMILFTVIKNRVYFVKTARYVNEMRSLAITVTNFENKSKMYCSFSKPNYFSISSTQIILALVCSFFNSICFVFLFQKTFNFNTFLLVLISFGIELIQIGFVVLYLNIQEKKS